MPHELVAISQHVCVPPHAVVWQPLLPQHMPVGHRTVMPEEQACTCTRADARWGFVAPTTLWCPQPWPPVPPGSPQMRWPLAWRPCPSSHPGSLTAQPVPSILQTFLLLESQQLNVVQPFWEQ